MQFVADQPRFELSWALQTALAAGLTVASIGVAVTFKRPAMRALVFAFSLLTVASGIIWFALTASSRGISAAGTGILISLALPLTPVLAFLIYRQMIDLLAGRTTNALPPASHLIMAAGLGYAVSVSIATLSAQRGPTLIGLLGTAGTLVALGVLNVFAGRAARKPGARAWALGLMQWSFLAFALRSTVNVVVAGVAFATGTSPDYTLGITLAQSSLLVLGAVLQLVAVLDEERAHSLAQAEALRQAEVTTAASQRLESLGQMAGAVAHDFNNVLTVILMSSQAALASPNASAEEDLREISTSATRGKEMTRQLLEFARQVPQQVTRFDANVQVDKLRGLLRRIVGPDATLEVSGGGPPLIVEMDATQFDQVVMNLVVNARDATPSGGTITVQIADSLPDIGTADASTRGGRGRFARLTVTDTGAGIPAEVLPQIFQPFFSTKRAGEGTGLGLATCDGIIRRAGGRIEVSSEEGKGTRFDVLIPRVTVA